MNLTNDQKRKVTIPASMSWYLEIHVECAVKSWNVSRATLKKEGWRSWHLQMHKDPVEKVKPSTAAHCLTNRQATGETRKMASQRIQHPTRGVFPEGLTASFRTDGSNTLAQNCHCEFCCGMHLTCKNASITPDRSGLMKWLAKMQEATIAIASVAEKVKKLLGQTDCENRAGKSVNSKTQSTWRFLAWPLAIRRMMQVRRCWPGTDITSTWCGLC